MLTARLPRYRKFFGILNLQAKLLFSSTKSSLNANKYAVKGDDNIVRSTVVKDIPNDRSLYDFVTSNIENNLDKVAFIDACSGNSLTYGSLQSFSQKFGSVLLKNGFKLNDTLCIFAPNMLNFVPVLLGTLAVGGCVSTANPLYTQRELVNQIIDSNSKMIATTNDLLDVAKAAADETGLKHIFTLDDAHGSQQDGIVRWSEIDSDVGDAFVNNSEKINVLEDCAILPYSSGTTGKPKGVMLTHHNVVANLIQFGHIFDIIPRNRVLGIVPFYHIYGLATILFSGIQSCKTTVVLPKFEPLTFLKAIQDYKVDYASLVPPLFLFLVKSPEVANYDISSLKYVTTGGAPFGPDLWKSFQEKYSRDIKIIQGYGLTETSPVATLTPADDVKFSSVGKPVPHTEIKVVDMSTGEALDVNQVGEVAIKGPNIMKGYLNNPSATAECISKDGWFFSGDIGYYDDEGNLYIVDRLKELIKYKGFQVPPAELEDLLLSHPKVSDVAVIGVPDEEAGELPKAFVVPKDEEVTEGELINFVELSVAPFKRLRGGVEFIDEIPKAASGKILRRILREM